MASILQKLQSGPLVSSIFRFSIYQCMLFGSGRNTNHSYTEMLPFGKETQL